MTKDISTSQTYTIMEASRLSGLPESTLRYYETIGIIEPIARDLSSKHRVYTESNINIIIAIACLSATGMSLEDMRAYLHNRERGIEGANGQIELLTAQKKRLAEEARQIEFRQAYVDLKIAYWNAISGDRPKEAQAIADQARAVADELKLPKE